MNGSRRTRRSTPRRRAACLVLAATLGAGTLTGCSAVGGDDDSDKKTAATKQVSGAEAVGIDPKNLPDPIASKTMKGSGPVKNVKVDLVALRNRGKVTQVVFALRPTIVDSRSVDVHSALGDRSPDIFAVDMKNLVKYSTIGGPSNTLGNDPVYTKLTGDTTTYYWAAIPTPEGDRVDVSFHENLTPFENIEVPKK